MGANGAWGGAGRLLPAEDHSGSRARLTADREGDRHVSCEGGGSNGVHREDTNATGGIAGIWAAPFTLASTGAVADYCIVRRHRVGHEVLRLVRRSLDEGTIAYTKASM